MHQVHCQYRPIDNEYSGVYQLIMNKYTSIQQKSHEITI